VGSNRVFCRGPGTTALPQWIWSGLTSACTYPALPVCLSCGRCGRPTALQRVEPESDMLNCVEFVILIVWSRVKKGNTKYYKSFRVRVVSEFRTPSQVPNHDMCPSWNALDS